MNGVDVPSYALLDAEQYLLSLQDRVLSNEQKVDVALGRETLGAVRTKEVCFLEILDLGQRFTQLMLKAGRLHKKTPIRRVNRAVSMDAEIPLFSFEFALQDPFGLQSNQRSIHILGVRIDQPRQFIDVDVLGFVEKKIPEDFLLDLRVKTDHYG